MSTRHDGESNVSHPSSGTHVTIIAFAALTVVTIFAGVALIEAFHYFAVLRSRRKRAAEAMAQVAEQERQRAVDRFCGRVRLHWEQERQRETRRREEENLPPYSREPKLPSFSEIDDVQERTAVDETRAQINGTASDS